MIVACVSFSSLQSEDNPEQQEDVTSGKKKRRKKRKKTKSEDFEAESEGPASYQEPPKIEVILSGAFIYHLVTPKTFCYEYNKVILIEQWNERFLFIFRKDEEEFPDLFLSLTVSDRMMPSSNAAKRCHEVSFSCLSSYMCAQLIISSFNTRI